MKQLIAAQAVLELELHQYHARIADIVGRGEVLASSVHAAEAQRIRQTTDAFTRRYEALQVPAKRRREALDASRQVHQLLFDADCELQWVGERMPLLVAQADNLTQALNAAKKHEQFEAEVHAHQAHVDEVQNRGRALAGDARVKEKLAALAAEWAALRAAAADKARALALAQRTQQYLSDADELRLWAQEQLAALRSDDLGQDEAGTDKLLGRHRALQTDMAAQRTWLANLDTQCLALDDVFRPRQTQLAQLFAEVEEAAHARRRALEDTLALYGYLRESAELEQWVNAQLQAAMSEEYGADYEHLVELLIRFDEFKQAVRSGSERFVLCEQAVAQLLARGPAFAAQVVRRQEELRTAWSLLLDYIETREKKLAAAEEIHRFNRDAAELLARIQQKSTAIGANGDLGRDVQSAHLLTKKHEALLHELNGMQEQLDALLAECARLIKGYPGGNAEHLQQQQMVG